MKNLLLIDDEPDLLVLMKKLLKKQGYLVSDAHGGREGLKIAREKHPDIIVLDAMMPDIDGWDVARELKSDPDTRDIPIVMLTVMSEPKYQKMSFDYSGADWHVPKPFEPDMLFSILSLAVEDRSVIEEKVEKAIKRDMRMKSVLQMINPKLLASKYDYLKD